MSNHGPRCRKYLGFTWCHCNKRPRLLTSGGNEVSGITGNIDCWCPSCAEVIRVGVRCRAYSKCRTDYRRWLRLRHET